MKPTLTGASRRLLASLALLSTLSATAQTPPLATPVSAGAPIPVQAFFAADAMSRPVLSPSGQHMAVRMAAAGGRQQLVVVTLEPARQAKTIVNFTDMDVGAFAWVNDERLVFTLNDGQEALANRLAPGLFAVDRTGENLRELVKAQPGAVQRTESLAGSRPLEFNHMLNRVLRDGSADVIIQRLNIGPRVGVVEVKTTTPLRLNTLTGRTSSLDLAGSPDALGWLFDDQGQVHMAVAQDKGEGSLFARDSAKGDWALVRKSAMTETRPGDFMPLGMAPDGKTYAVVVQDNAEQTTALVTLDGARRAVAGEPLLAVPGFDFAGGLIFNGKTRQLAGIRYTSDATGTAWLDAGYKTLQAEVDKALPGRNNLLTVAECGCSAWSVVTSYSDRQPARFYLMNLQAGRLESIGAAKPAIDPARMATQDFERVKARDGLSLPVRVTKPVGKGPWPAVVMLHGGPWLRGGAWGWQPVSQFLASRGYVVLEPEFRGSTGFGLRHFQASFRQWGLAMQDDVTDVTRWAIDKGLVDGGRVCIAGASYGGYSALMGLVREPGMYRCAVATAAPSDLAHLMEQPWSDIPGDAARYGMARLIGDPKADAAQLDAASPLKQASKIRQPVLLVHGGTDRRVPIDHAKRLRDAITAAQGQVEWLDYAEEGHGIGKPANQLDYWTRVEAFLARHTQAAR